MLCVVKIDVHACHTGRHIKSDATLLTGVSLVGAACGENIDKSSHDNDFLASSSVTRLHLGAVLCGKGAERLLRSQHL